MTPEEDLLERLAYEIWAAINTHDLDAEARAGYKAHVWDRLVAARAGGQPESPIESIYTAARAAIAFLAVPPPPIVACACKARRQGSLRIIG